MHCQRGLVSAMAVLLLLVGSRLPGQSQSESDQPPVRGSLVEDRAARKLLDAGDSRFEVDEVNKAIEIWESVIERYPRSRVRFDAHMRLGNHFLEREQAYEKARAHFEAVAAEENRDEAQRAEATLKVGICFHESRKFGKSFQVLRKLIKQFPVSGHVNQAYYYIGLGHFQLGHYSRAIAALEKVGTTLGSEDAKVEKLEAGKRFFVKIEDADLAALDPGEGVQVECQADSGDTETVECFPVGRNVRVVLGSIQTRLGQPKPGNGELEVQGQDTVTVQYIDAQTADKQFDQEVIRKVSVVGDAVVAVTDGAFRETLDGVVLGKSANIEISDADRDVSDQADTIQARVEVYRPKTREEIEAETAEAVAQEESAAESAAGEKGSAETDEGSVDGEPKEEEIDRFKRVDSLKIRLKEAAVQHETVALPEEVDPEAEPQQGAESEPEANESGTNKDSASDGSASSAQADDGKSSQQAEALHTGVFRTTVPILKAGKAKQGDDVLQALPGDKLRVVYLDERHRGEGIRQVQKEVQAVEGNLGGVRVTKADISDQELRIETNLKTANALTKIGNRYQDFGLEEKANAKYQQALQECEKSMQEAQQLGGRFLEETYVQLWHVYYKMGRLELAAAMAQRLQREFPNSGFVDDALLQLADVAREQDNMRRAIGIYTRLVGMESSQLRGEAQYGIAQCYEQMAQSEEGQQSAQYYDRAFQEYKKVYEQFPESGRVGEAVAKMANYYYQQKDYARAIDTFETVLSNYPDAKFLDVILFNYGRCLYRMDRKREARQRFDQLIAEYPESPLASDAKKISEALAKAGT